MEHNGITMPGTKIHIYKKHKLTNDKHWEIYKALFTAEFSTLVVWGTVWFYLDFCYITAKCKVTLNHSIQVRYIKMKCSRHTCCVCSLKTFVCSSRSSFSLWVFSSSCWRKESCSSRDGSFSALTLASCSDLSRFLILMLCFSCSIKWVLSKTFSFSLSSLFSFCCRGRVEAHVLHVIWQLPMTQRFSNNKFKKAKKKTIKHAQN